MPLLLLTLIACDPRPQEGTPGLEPPHERFGDAGAVLMPGDEGMMASQGGRRAPGNAMGSPEQPANSAGSGSTPTTPSAGSGAGGSTGMAMMPPPTGVPNDSTDSDGEDGGVDVDTRNPLFVGLWVIEQGAPTQYQATLYELQAGGDLLQHDTFDFGPLPSEGFVTGTVERASGGARCAFEQRWRADGARELRVDARCSDMVPREVVLAFPAGDELQGLTPSIASVAGETEGWVHGASAWTFRKCKNRELCFPF